MPSIARSRVLRFRWVDETFLSTFAEGRDAEEDEEDRGEVRRVILAGGVSGEVLLKRSQICSVLALKSEKRSGLRSR